MKPNISKYSHAIAVGLKYFVYISLVVGWSVSVALITYWILYQRLIPYDRLEYDVHLQYK
jgi:hypothetical protein